MELDVHFSRDGHIVVIHDDTAGPYDRRCRALWRTERFQNCGGLDAGSWFGPEYAGERIRSLAEIFEEYKGRLYFHIEIKAHAEGLASRTADMVRAHGYD